MHVVGKAFPRTDRAPAIEPVSEQRIRERLEDTLMAWRLGASERVASGFYTSQAMRLDRRA
jgi:magnesium-protoporphyrin O-methyltransferase